MPILSQIADNPALMDALKDFLLAHFSTDGLSDQMTNEALGQIVRACLDGRARIDAAFTSLASFSTPQTLKEKENPSY